MPGAWPVLVISVSPGPGIGLGTKKEFKRLIRMNTWRTLLRDRAAGLSPRDYPSF